MQHQPEACASNLGDGSHVTCVHYVQGVGYWCIGLSVANIMHWQVGSFTLCLTQHVALGSVIRNYWNAVQTICWWKTIVIYSWPTVSATEAGKRIAVANHCGQDPTSGLLSFEGRCYYWSRSRSRLITHATMCMLALQLPARAIHSLSTTCTAVWNPGYLCDI